jgi:hypothetical protein
MDAVPAPNAVCLNFQHRRTISCPIHPTPHFSYDNIAHHFRLIQQKILILTPHFQGVYLVLCFKILLIYSELFHSPPLYRGEITAV